MNKKIRMSLILMLVAALLLVACAPDEPAESSAKNSGNPAMVDGVEVVTRNEHQYAIVIGFYPDPCTRISEIEQDVDGNRFVISLSTNSPDDMLCAQMLEAYEVTLLLETGGLLPGEYTVEVNGREASFVLGQ